MRLVSEVLDMQLVDRRQRKIGKVDGLVLEIRENDLPRLAAIELGAAVLARRIGRRRASWALAANRFWGVRRDPCYRVPWERVLDVGLDIEVDLDAKNEPPLDWERWLREHILERLPFA